MMTGLLVLWFTVTGAVISLYFRQVLRGCWLEPALRRPVVIIESDDWGAGPAAGQAEALKQISAMLSQITDGEGRCPVMTLGMILASPDGKKIDASGCYHRSIVSSQTHGAMLDAINRGVETGAFSIQLHGMEHYWPPALMDAAESSAEVRDWISRSPDAFAEELPSHLQSRWVDASHLPSVELADEDLRLAVQEEVAAFQSVFSARPVVAVPPTFIWNERVEQAWAESGIAVVITPGRRIESRDADGRPETGGKPVFNGLTDINGIVYLVRDAYFEPALGHKAAQAIDTFKAKARLGRPVLFETHRFNFVGEKAEPGQAIKELDNLLRGALATLPDLAFISSAKLASMLRDRNPEWVECGLRRRLHVWINRAGEISRLRRLVACSGWIVPVCVLWALSR